MSASWRARISAVRSFRWCIAQVPEIRRGTEIERLSRYAKLLDNAVTRWDVDFVIGEFIGELNASHTYKGGGDIENVVPLVSILGKR